MRQGHVWSVAILISVTAGCGGGGGGGTTNPPPPPPAGGSFTITVTPATLSIARGDSGTVTITVARSGAFTGPVTLSVAGTPSGVIGVFNSAQVGGSASSSSLTLTASSTAAAATATVTVTGTGAGVSSQTATVQLTVTVPPAQTGPFTLSSSATSYLIHPNTILFTSPIITIARNAGFTGSVAFSYSGLPSSLFIGFTPSSTAGNTTTAVVLSTGGTPPGTYTATIRGASAQGDRTITLQVVVAQPTTGSIRWKYCSASMPRVFFAVKDGNGPWTRVMPSGVDTSYSFNLPSGAGQVAEVNAEAGGFRTTVFSGTATELAARGASQCTLIQNATGRTVNGSFAGVTGFRTSQVGMGWWFGSANGNGTFTMLNLPPGPVDLVAARNGEVVNFTDVPVDRFVIRRGLNPASGSTLPAVDFNAAESFAPTTATWTFGNTLNESFSVTQTFITAGGSSGHFALQPGVDHGALGRTVYGVPLAQTITGDLHQVVATVATLGPTPTSPNTYTRQIVAYGRSLSDRTLSFGPPLPLPNVGAVPGNTGGLLRAQGTLQTEYNAGVTFDVTQASSRNFFTVHATRGFLGAGNSYDVSMPDLSGAVGWDTQFAIRAGSSVQWWVSGGGPVLDYGDVRYLYNSTRTRWTGILSGITQPRDGDTFVFARATGTVIP